MADKIVTTDPEDLRDKVDRLHGLPVMDHVLADGTPVTTLGGDDLPQTTHYRDVEEDDDGTRFYRADAKAQAKVNEQAARGVKDAVDAKAVIDDAKTLEEAERDGDIKLAEEEPVKAEEPIKVGGGG